MDWDYGVAVESSAVLPPARPSSTARSSTAAATVAALNPATEEPLAQVGTAGPAEVERAVAAARRAQGTWAALPGAERARLLFRFARVVAGRAPTWPCSRRSAPAGPSG